MDYIPTNPPHSEGVLMRRKRGRGRMRRLRAGLVTPSPGGLGQPSVPTMRDCLEWLDAARTKGGGSCPDRGRRSLPVRARKLRPRGQKSPPWSAEWRARLRQARQRPEALDCWLRRSALHSLGLARGPNKGPAIAGREYGAPAPQRTGVLALARNLSADIEARGVRMLDTVIERNRMTAHCTFTLHSAAHRILSSALLALARDARALS